MGKLALYSSMHEHLPTCNPYRIELPISLMNATMHNIGAKASGTRALVSTSFEVIDAIDNARPDLSIKTATGKKAVRDSLNRFSRNVKRKKQGITKQAKQPEESLAMKLKR